MKRWVQNACTRLKQERAGNLRVKNRLEICKSTRKKKKKKVLSSDLRPSPRIERTMGEISDRTNIISIERIRRVLEGVVEFHCLFINERRTGGSRKMLFLLG
ncbi:hypothetical protein PanWU01x14_263460 [Parasponia andersonii]|uniref:Uncharacterized protein n=1 Tax=Parasponia andersonii TaxID=3476 RepID=A0A2P5B7X6_PARAD|nr:hypothetical protein PanWU01x14_263460 [Parasponia andersonii]